MGSKPFYLVHLLNILHTARHKGHDRNGRNFDRTFLGNEIKIERCISSVSNVYSEKWIDKNDPILHAFSSDVS